MLVNIWRLTAASHLFYYLRTHPKHHSVDTGQSRGKKMLLAAPWTHFPAESFNVQVDFCQWGNLEVPQPIRNVKFMLPSKLRSYLIRLRSSYTRTNYYNYSLGKFKSVQTPCLPLPCSGPDTRGSEWRKVMGDKSPELVLHLTYELSRNISLMTRGSLAQKNVRPVQPSAETENINIHTKNKSRHKKYEGNKHWLPVGVGDSAFNLRFDFSNRPGLPKNNEARMLRSWDPWLREQGLWRSFTIFIRQTRSNPCLFGKLQ